MARRAFSLLRSYGVPCEIRTYKRRAFERGTRYQIHLEDDARALQVLNEAGILDAGLAPLERPPRAGRRAAPCCRAAYLRGAFLAAGSVSGPRNAHLELRAADADGAAFLAELAARGRLRARRRRAARPRGRLREGRRDDRRAARVPRRARGGARAWARRRSSSATRARANRLANADHANLVPHEPRRRRCSSARSARLEREGRLDELAPELREIARPARPPSRRSSLRELAAPLHARRRRRPRCTAAWRKLQRLAEL